MRVFKKLIITPIIICALLFASCSIKLEDTHKEAINGIYENNVISSNVVVETYTFLGVKSSQGSGVIFSKNGSTYYALTNNHVIYDGYRALIKDAYGERLMAEVVCSDVEYDLAVIRFNSDVDYYVPKICETDPQISENVICIGNPNGLVNSVTIGEVVDFKQVPALNGDTLKDDEGSNVTFSVIQHDAHIDEGSSGGAIFNYNYEI